MGSLTSKQRATTLKRQGFDDGVIGAILGINSDEVQALLFDAAPVVDAPSLVRACFEDSIVVQRAAGVGGNIAWPSPYVDTFVADGLYARKVPDNRALAVFLNAGIGYEGGAPSSGQASVWVFLANDDTGTNSRLTMSLDPAQIPASAAGGTREFFARPLWSPVDYDHEVASDGNYWYSQVNNDTDAVINFQLDLYVVELPVSPYA